MSYLLTINAEDKLSINSDQLKKLIYTDNEGVQQVRFNHKNYRYEVLSRDGKQISILLDGKVYNIEIKNELDLTIERMGLSEYADFQASDIYSPMPGLVLDIEVQDGDLVEEGQTLLILEAMKMENIIKATGSGKVTGIKIEKGDKVEKGQLLIEIEPS